MAGRRPTCHRLVFTPRLTLKRAVATAAMTGAAGAAVFSAAAAFTTISTLATTATLFGKSGGADSACPSSITISPSIKTSARFDKSLTIPVSGLSVNGAQCQGSGVLVGGPHSVFAGENNVDRPLGQVKKVYLDTGVQLLERQLLQASGNDFDVFFFPLDADTLCGSWRVSKGTALTVFRAPVDFLWGEQGIVQRGAVQMAYSPERPLNCMLTDRHQPAPSVAAGVVIPTGILSSLVFPTPGPTASPTAAPSATPTPTPPPTASPTPSATASPTPTRIATPTPTAEADGDSCFPASAKVQLADGSHVPLHALPVGASVRVAAGVHDSAHSAVIGWSHKAGDVQSEFVAVTHTAGKLLLSPGHYVYVGGEAVTARSVQPGDVLTLGNGGVASVTEVGREVAAGLYNAHTAHGDVVVDGVVVSTYTDAVHPVVAHALLAPVRLAVRLGVVDPLGSFLYGTRPWLSALAPRGN
ncbi:hypothetical protein I4F81_012621 [Pyropia yezoensis]|uniref:Uncharacterized protein n=1 Tax=Pyropia yezoensis TaxID=2788 RepID=A0ACC3CJY8_PYRYE|nr:hypothetical protein I4F81_012621 [Neopyropia yezoensis]